MNALRRGHPLALGALFGALDAAWTFVAGGTGGGVLTAIVGAWLLTAWAVGTLWRAGWTLAAGRGGVEGHREAVAAWCRAAWYEEDAEVDRQRGTRLAGWVAGLVVWLAGSIALLVYLVENRHGALLIAVTQVVGQLVIAAVALWIGMLKCSLEPKIARAMGLQPIGWRTLVMGLTGLGAAGIAIGVLVGWEILVATDALSLVVLPGLLVGLLLTTGTTERILPRSGWIALPLGLLLLWLGCQSDQARVQVLRNSQTAKYVISGLQRLSDVDGDGVGAFPIAEDCAAFDSARSPMAIEIPGNGVDEDCDGEDVAVGVFEPPRSLHEVEVPAGSPDLVLITIDSLRPEHLGFGGATREGVSPNLDAFAAKSVVFDNAFSQDSGTGPSLWSLMAGKTPFQTRVDNSGLFPPNFLESEVTLPKRLQAAGYHTVALLCGQVFATRHWNMKEGFATYREVCGKTVSKQAERVTKVALEALQKARANQKPVFLWVHYYDPHEPYHDHPELDFGSDPKSRYDEEIAYTDVHLGPLLKQLTAPDQRRTYVALTADHGENFGEHGKAPHARTLYYEVTHVPLLFWGTDIQARRVAEYVALNDIHPTFLELAHQPTDHSTMGSQVATLWGHPADPERLVYQENSFARPRRHVKGVVGLDHHMLMDLTTGTVELYDLRTDTREAHNLYGRDLEVEARLERALKAFIPTTKVPTKLAK